MRPDTDRERPTADGALSEGNNGQHQHDDSTEQWSLRLDVCEAVLGLVLNAPLDRAIALVDELHQDDFPDPRHKFTLAAIRAAMASGEPPEPAVVAVAAMRAGIRPPPGWRGLLLTELRRLANVVLPLASAGWYIEQLRGFTIRRDVAANAQSLQERSELGDLDDLRGLLEQHIRDLGDLVVRIDHR